MLLLRSRGGFSVGSDLWVVVKRVNSSVSDGRTLLERLRHGRHFGTGIWMDPVKYRRGERSTAVQLGTIWIEGDRVYGFRELEGVSLCRAKRIPNLMHSNGPRDAIRSDKPRSSSSIPAHGA